MARKKGSPETAQTKEMGMEGRNTAVPTSGLV